MVIQLVAQRYQRKSLKKITQPPSESMNKPGLGGGGGGTKITGKAKKNEKDDS